MRLGFLNRDWQVKRQVVDELVQNSKADKDYYFLLSLATGITTIGIIYEDLVVFLGGILVAPILSPVLALGLSVVTGNVSAIFRALRNITLSIMTAIILAYTITFIFRIPFDHIQVLAEQLRVGSQYLYVAIFSGVAASYSWIKQKSSVILPGVAMSVSLLPPLCFAGIAWYAQMGGLVSESLLLFTLNLLGITLSSAVVFLITGFSSLSKEEEKIIKAKG